MRSLIKGKPIKVIVLFAIPLYIGQLFQLCYGLIDTRIIGSILGEVSLAAVGGATTSLSDMLIEFLNGIVCGFGIIIATFFGADDEKKMQKAVGGSIVLGVAATFILSLLSLLLLPQILEILHVSEELVPQAAAYIRIILAGLIATTLYNIYAAILRAIGDSYTPLVFLVISNLLNIILDYVCIACLQMGVSGAAYATVFSQALSAVLCFLYMRRKYPQLKIGGGDFWPDGAVYRQLLPTGLSMGFMISFVTLGSLALQTCINTFGINIIVAHTAARKATSIFLTPFFSLGSALATYCGQNLGADEYGRIRKGIADTIRLSMVWCVIVLLVVFSLSTLIISGITASREGEIIETASLYLKVNAVFYFLPAVICILRNSMQGFGDTKTPLISSFIELAGKVAIAYLLAPAIGYMGVIVSEPIVWMFMVIPLLIGMAKNPVIGRTGL